MTGRKVVVIGGGFGGAAAAIAARAELGPEHEVTLIDRSRRTYLCGGMPLLVVGERDAQSISRSLGTLANRGVRYEEAEVRSIDTAGRTVDTTSGTLEYDYLVLAPGAHYNWDAVPGSREAYSFYNLETARRLRRRLGTFRRGRILIAVASTPYKCPPAPFEAAMLMDWCFKQAGVRKDVEIHVFTPEPAPLGMAGPEAVQRLKADLARRGVQLHTEMAVKEIERSGRDAAFSNGESMDADLIVTIPTHTAAPVVAEAGLTGPSGWVPVDKATLKTSVGNVFAIGDVNVIMMANDRPVPKAGVFASAEGQTVGHNIAAEINGGEPTAFPGVGYCFLATSGETAGVMEGRFLADGKPDVQYRPGTARGMKRKERWEQDWRRFRV